jgi:hypothetical protein
MKKIFNSMVVVIWCCFYWLNSYISEQQILKPKNYELELENIKQRGLETSNMLVSDFEGYGRMNEDLKACEPILVETGRLFAETHARINGIPVDYSMVDEDIKLWRQSYVALKDELARNQKDIDELKKASKIIENGGN